MKKTAAACLCAAILAAIALSFSAGRRLESQRNLDSGMRQCRMELSFAADLAAKQDLSDPDMMETISSHVYAAYALCDDPELAAALYELWNDLIFRGEEYLDHEDLLIVRLSVIQEALHTQASARFP